jgi:putative transposase
LSAKGVVFHGRPPQGGFAKANLGQRLGFCWAKGAISLLAWRQRPRICSGQNTTNAESAIHISNVRARMHAYLATISRDFGTEFAHVGGVADHVHIIAALPRTVSQAEFIEQIKKTSSKWIKSLSVRYRGFFWQRGYRAFSVSPSLLDSVLQSVKTQQTHHYTRTFQEEYREFLLKHGIDFDERYVWA